MAFDTLGIIPAAGKAIRFGGIIKECLPVSIYETLLDRAVNQLKKHCDEVVLVTSAEKIGDHGNLLKDSVLYMVQDKEYDDMWGAMLEGMSIPAERYIMVMPDTYIPDFVDPLGDFALGMFWTVAPNRFGVLRDDLIVNKKDGPPGNAWGVLIWSKDVRDFWYDSNVSSYTFAINMAMAEYGYNLFDLDYYHDMATFDDYKRLIKERL